MDKLYRTLVTRTESSLEIYRKKIKFQKITKAIISILLPTVSVFIVVRIRLSFAEQLYPTTYQYLFLVVFLYAAVGNKMSALTASLLATIAGNYYLMEPVGVFKIGYPIYLIPTITFFVQCILGTFLLSSFRTKSIKLKKLQMALESTKEKFSYATSKDSALFIVTSNEGLILDANKTTSDILAIDKDNLFGQILLNLPFWSTNEDQRLRLKEIYAKIKDKKTIKYEDTFFFPKKGLTEVEINLISTMGETNEPIIILTITDITDKKVNLRRQSRERKVYSHLINSDFMGLVFTDKDRRITNANKQFLKLLGRDLESILRSELSMIHLVPERYHNAKADLIKKILFEGFGGPVEIEIVNSTGAMIPVLLSGVIFDPDKEIYLFFIIDLSEQKKLEKKKDEFISVASHEIKTPITIIKGYLQLIDQRKATLTKDKIEHILYIIQGEVEKLNSLMDEMLDISRIETNRLTLNASPTDMRKLIESVLESIKPLRKSREIILEASEEQIVTNIDGKRITQVLTNLLTNAIKYTPKDKKIIVRLINLPKSIRVEVQDFGEGIHPEKKVRIFEKFFQIDRGTPNTQGMGLGLFISKAIIETHKGKIGVKSKLGEGSTFYFQLPK